MPPPFIFPMTLVLNIVLVMSINFRIVLSWQSKRGKGWCHWNVRNKDHGRNFTNLLFSIAKVYDSRYKRLYRSFTASCFMHCKCSFTSFNLTGLQKRKHLAEKWWFIDSVMQHKLNTGIVLYGKLNFSFSNNISLQITHSGLKFWVFWKHIPPPGHVMN